MQDGQAQSSDSNPAASPYRACRFLADNLFDGVYFVDRDRKITFWSPSAEEITGFKSSEVLGRCCCDNILVHVDQDGCCLCEEKCLLARAIGEGQSCGGEAFFRHRNGHRVPVVMRTVPLKEPDGRVAAAVSIFRENTSGAATRRVIEDLRRLALLDPLTDLPNRRYLEGTLHSSLEEMRRYAKPFGVLFIDIDDFKKVNDTRGHDAGDGVLKMVAKTLTHNMRAFDHVGRWGGEEFVAIIINVDAEELHAIADKLRALVEQSALAAGPETLSVTVSLGGTLAEPEDSKESLLDRADRLMYQSKLEGKNRVTVVSARPAGADRDTP